MIEYPPITPILWFNTLEEALSPLSAGTEVLMCIQSCDGQTYEFITVPHPTYTNEFGKAVIQLDAIELGGMNGLNS